MASPQVVIRIILVSATLQFKPLFSGTNIRKVLIILQKEVRWGLTQRDKEFLRPKDLKLVLDIPHNWGSWFYFKYHTVNSLFCSFVTPQHLRITIQDRVFLLEIMHQLVEADKSLVGWSHKKGSMIPSQVMIGMYHFLNRKAYKILDSIINKYRLPRVKYRFYDTEWFVKKLEKVNISKHEWDDKEDLIRNAKDYNDVLKINERWYKI